MNSPKLVKLYKVGNSHAVRIPSEYKFSGKQAYVYYDNTPSSVNIIYKFPKKHARNAFASGAWKNMNASKTNQMLRSLGISKDQNLKGNERWHY